MSQKSRWIMALVIAGLPWAGRAQADGGDRVTPRGLLCGDDLIPFGGAPQDSTVAATRVAEIESLQGVVVRAREVCAPADNSEPDTTDAPWCDAFHAVVRDRREAWDGMAATDDARRFVGQRDVNLRMLAQRARAHQICRGRGAARVAPAACERLIDVELRLVEVSLPAAPPNAPAPSPPPTTAPGASAAQRIPDLPGVRDAGLRRGDPSDEAMWNQMVAESSTLEPQRVPVRCRRFLAPGPNRVIAQLSAMACTLCIHDPSPQDGSERSFQIEEQQTTHRSVECEPGDPSERGLIALAREHSITPHELFRQASVIGISAWLAPLGHEGRARPAGAPELNAARRTLTRLGQFYEYVAANPEVTDLLRHADGLETDAAASEVLRRDARRPTPDDLTRARIYADSAFAREREWRATAGSECLGSHVYVAPSGALHVDAPSDEPSPALANICVDVADFAMDRPLTVIVRSGARVQEIRAWPGERTSLGHSLPLTGTLDVQVISRARGRSLRALAVYNDLIASRMADDYVVPGDLVAATEQLAREEARVAASSLEYDTRVAIAAALTASAEGTAYAEALSRILPGVPDAQVTRPNILAAIQSLVRFLMRQSAAMGTDETRARSPIADVIGGFEARLRTLSTTVSTTPVAQRDALLRIDTDIRAPIRPADAGREGRDLLRRTLRQRVALLCELASHPITVVRHQVVLDRAALVIEFDYHSGMRGDASRGQRLRSDRDVFVRVWDVPGGTSLRLELNDVGVAVAAPVIVGAPAESSAPVAGSAATASTLDSYGIIPGDDAAYVARRRREVELPGSVVVALGRLPGARVHSLRVCALRDTLDGVTSCIPAAGATAAAAQTAPAAPVPASPRLIGDHALRVHGRHAFGVRAGLGVNILAPGDVSLERRPSDGSDWVVVRDPVAATFAVPLLAVGYVTEHAGGTGRDVLCDWDSRCGFEAHLGFGFGVDIADPTHTFYPFAVVLDFSGIAVSAAAVLHWSEAPRLPIGDRLISPNAPPDVSGFGTAPTFAGGAMISLTLDFDIFQRLFIELLADASKTRVLAQAGGTQ